MAKVYISEFGRMMRIEGQGIGQIADWNSFISTTVKDTSGGHQELTLNAGTQVIRIGTDGIISYKIGGASTVASTSDARLPANATEYNGVNGGQTLSVITNT